MNAGPATVTSLCDLADAWHRAEKHDISPEKALELAALFLGVSALKMPTVTKLQTYKVLATRVITR